MRAYLGANRLHIAKRAYGYVYGYKMAVWAKYGVSSTGKYFPPNLTKSIDRMPILLYNIINKSNNECLGGQTI